MQVQRMSQRFVSLWARCDQSDRSCCQCSAYKFGGLDTDTQGMCPRREEGWMILLKSAVKGGGATQRERASLYGIRTQRAAA